VRFRFPQHLRSKAQRFIRDESGVLTILAILFFVMVMAVGGLGIDLGRLYGERSQMQAYVDHAALSAASQLDTQSGALQRAIRAAMGDGTAGPLISGRQSFADGQPELTLEKLTFLDYLDPSWTPRDPTPWGSDNVLCTYSGGALSCLNGVTVAQAEAKARFVEVWATRRTVSYYILPLVDFIGRIFGAPPMIDKQGISLRATAGYKREVCDLTPLMICNPDEPSTNTDTLYPYTPLVGQQILMKASGSGSAWAPGNFGLLQPASDAGGVCKGNPHGAGFITCVLGLVDPLTQCTDGSVNVKPGQAETTMNGFNARFDIYQGSGNKMGGDPLFAPSANVTKGVVGRGGGKCPNNYDPAPSDALTVPLPRDAEILAGTSRFGENCWYAYTGQPKPSSCPAGQTWPPTGQDAYWDTNHPGMAYPTTTLGTTPTRYSVYRYEIDNGMIPNRSSDGGENGNPKCTAPGINNPNRDRRVLTMAVVNCGAVGLRGQTSNTETYSGIPTVAFVKMFMTEPIGLAEDVNGTVTGLSSSENDLYGEVVGVIEPGDDSGILHVNPVLYR